MGPLRNCGCGKKQYRLRCAEKDTLTSCGKQCGKLLSCGKHYCSEVCHRTPCPPCEEYMSRRCYCTKTQKEVRCGEERQDKIPTQLQEELGTAQYGYFSCEKTCGSLLDCGIHRCKSRCHAGDCVGCRFLPGRVEFCPCGVTPLGRLSTKGSCNIVREGRLETVHASGRSSCTDPVPTCDNKCGKLKPCGHSCDLTCHNGECPTCTKVTHVSCACRATSFQPSCADFQRAKKSTIDLQVTLPPTTSVREYCSRQNVAFEEGEEVTLVSRVHIIDIMLACLSECRRSLSCGRHKCEEICCPIRGVLQSAASAASEGLNEELSGLNIGQRSRRSQRSRRTQPSANQSQQNAATSEPEVVQQSGAFRRILFLLSRSGVNDAQHIHSLLTSGDVSVRGVEGRTVTLKNVSEVDHDSRVHSFLDCATATNPTPDEFSPSQGPDHMCFRTCNRLLGCKLHYCPDICHRGTCNPCPVLSSEAMVCDCGKTRVEPPVPCETQLPTCPYPCTKVRSCGHPQQSGHKCHPGECPPCTAPTSKTCAGEHTVVQNVPCNVQHVSCGQLCGKPLSCGIHTCKNVCHSGPCQPTVDRHLDEAVSCGHRCGKKRKHCSHTCNQVCHPSSECPVTACQEPLKLFCRCNRLFSWVYCLHGTPDSTLVAKVDISEVWEQLKSKFSASLQQKSESSVLNKLWLEQDCQYTHFEIPCPGSVLESLLLSRRLTCNDYCSSASFARSFGEAVGVTPGSGTSWDDGRIGYCPFPGTVISFAQSHASWACKLDDQLRDFAERLALIRQRDPLSSDAQPWTINVGKVNESEKAFAIQLGEVYGFVPTSLNSHPSLPLTLRWSGPKTLFDENRVHVESFLSDSLGNIKPERKSLIFSEFTELLVQSALSLYTREGDMLAIDGPDQYYPVPILPTQQLKDAIRIRKADTHAFRVVSHHPMEPDIADIPEDERGCWVFLHGMPKKYKSDDVVSSMYNAGIHVSSQVKTIKRLDEDNVLVKFGSPGVAARAMQLLTVALSAGRLDWPFTTQIRHWGVGVASAMNREKSTGTKATAPVGYPSQGDQKAGRIESASRPPPAGRTSSRSKDAWDL
eukprot:gb/GECG01013210.1/.p1 GENE.gb/GECG01013210.1/~~gb/GECG01013210.1/.p1  ORF type:complete len:1083 (+),score=57.84 gb/GECG01013210.1/:1-3249(+)